MSRLLLTIIRIALLVLLGETFITPAVTFAGIGPDFTLIGLVILTLAAGTRVGIVGGFVLGLILDSGVANLLGLHALLKSLSGYAVGRFSERVVPGVTLVEVFALALLALVHDSIRLIVSAVLIDSAIVRPFFLEVVPSALYTATLGVVLIRLAELAGILRRSD
jgi:rod shape-determining protein MreD